MRVIQHLADANINISTRSPNKKAKQFSLINIMGRHQLKVSSIANLEPSAHWALCLPLQESELSAGLRAQKHISLVHPELNRDHDLALPFGDQ